MCGCGCSQSCLGDLSRVYGLRGLGAPVEPSVLGKDFFYGSFGDQVPPDVGVIYHPHSDLPADIGTYDQPGLSVPTVLVPPDRSLPQGQAPQVQRATIPGQQTPAARASFPWLLAIAAVGGFFLLSKMDKKGGRK